MVTNDSSIYTKPSLQSEVVNKIYEKKSETESWKKSRNFRYGLPEYFLSKGKKTPQVGLEG